MQGHADLQVNRPQAPEEPLDFAIDTSHNAAFVFMGPYIDDARNATTRYPGGIVEEQVRNGEVLFRAYFVPAER